MKRRRQWLVGGVAALWLAGSWNGVTAQTALPQTTQQALGTLADAAAVIFTGTVTAVRRVAPAAPGAAGIVEVDFEVTDAVRGVTGSTYTLREWAGLWPGNDQPFAHGQRYLMLLHTPNAAGLSSPVGGPDGAIPIHAASAGSANGETIASASSVTGATGTIASGEVIDLGWIATRVQVPLAYQTSAARPIGGTNAVQAQAVAAPHNMAAATQTSSNAGLPAPISPSVRKEQYSAVLNELRNREAVPDVTR